jgi:L-iditol 2-dehydrogenase
MTTPSRRAFVKIPFQVEIRQDEIADPGPGQLLVDIAACSVCGTDLSIAGKTAKNWSSFGHEISGIVRAVGDGVSRFKVGDRVAMDSSAPCGVCSYCTAGRAMECRTVKSYWGGTMGFADGLLTPQECAFQAGDLPADVASLLEPLGVSIDLVTVADVGPGDRVLIIGPGPLGLLAIPVARQRGAAKVWLAGRAHSVARMAAGQALGAELIALDQTDIRKYDFGPDGVNRILVVAPPTELPLAMDLGAKGCIISYIGISFNDEAKISFNADTFHFKRQQLRASMASPGTRGPASLAMLRSGYFDPRLVISHRFPLADLPRAMLQNRDDKATVKKMTMINPTNDWARASQP